MSWTQWQDQVLHIINNPDDEKKRISQRLRGVPKNKVSCLCCRKEVGINIFPRWHGDNCKNR